MNGGAKPCLSILKRLGYITGWYDHKISPGMEWKTEIINQLNAAHIILLLVSPNFMSSDYCYGVEMKYALKRHNDGYARVIPILLKAVDWKDAPFSHLQMLPTNLRPVTSWRDRNEAFRDIALAIHRVVEELAPHMNKTEQEQEEEGARQIIEWALEGEPLGAAILARALEEAEKSILFMSERYELQYPDQNGKLQPCTLATLPEPAATTTTLLAMTAFTLLCGDKGDKEWYFITADDILDIEEFIKHSPLYVPSQKWPFTKEQIRAA